MDLETIVAELKKERDRISRAIAALEGLDSSTGAMKKSVAAPGSATLNKTRRGSLTPAGRKRLSESMKKRWAERGRKELQPAKVRPYANVSGATIAARIEQAFQKQPKWTIPALMSAAGVKYRSSVWTILNRLVKERKVRLSIKAVGRRPAEYTRVTK